MRSYVLLMVCGVFASAVSQLLLKKSAEKTAGLPLVRQYLTPLVIVGYGLLFCAMLVSIFAYRVVPLKYGAVIESLGYMFILFLSAVFLREPVTRKKLAGLGLIILGILIFSL